MITPLTPAEREHIVDLVKLVVGAAAPEIIKCVAASRGGVRVEAIGDVLSVVPEPPGGPRDYRKELWIAVFLKSFNEYDADQALQVFNSRFPSATP